MNFINLFGIILVSLIASTILRRYVPEYALIINIISGVIITIFLISTATPLIDYIKELFGHAKIPSEYMAVLLKSLGICFISQFAYDTCIDNGEKALASKVEFAGKIGVFLCALPLFRQITQTALKFVGY